MALALVVTGGLHDASAQSIALVEFAVGLSSPVKIASAGDDRLFVVEQAGTIRVVQPPGTVLPLPFLNISGRVTSGGERGLLGLAFHPDYLTNGHFYVNYTGDDAGQLQTRISRFTAVGDPATSSQADPNSELVLLAVDQDFGNHNGGDLHFGPDGLLYIGLGDGGSAGDPNNRAQDPQALLGKMLRLDVDRPAPYVPPSNPFVGDGSTLEEIFALGLRNPWRFSFDRSTGDLYIADVGQRAREEIDRQLAASVAAHEARNWGWRCYEGDATFNLAGCAGPADYAFPIHDYTHDGGRCSITGGFVYRGAAFPVIEGLYFFSDYCTSEFFALEFTPAGALDRVHDFGVPVAGLSPTAFGEDREGELYVAGAGKIYRVTASPPASLSCDVTPRAGCRLPVEPNRAMLAIRRRANSSRNKLTWKWRRGAETERAHFGDPTRSTAYGLCVYDSGPGLISEAQIAAGGRCGGRDCWRETGAGFRYKDRAAANDGIKNVRLRAGPDAKAKIVVRAKGGAVDLPPAFPLSQPVTVQLVNSVDGCWEAVYSAPAVRNEQDAFRDRAD